MLYEHQKDALRKLKNGCILCAKVGVGKSRTALAYFYANVCGGDLDTLGDLVSPRDIYVITTAKKRDDKDWEREAIMFGISTDPEESTSGVKLTVDSWNNISKYKDVQNAFFIFDEQRIGGGKVWAETFVKIAKVNQWILLTATPGDKWIEYLPVFRAHGFFKNKSEFYNRHCVFDPYRNYPSIKSYIREEELDKLAKQILIKMEFTKRTTQHHEDVFFSYDVRLYKRVYRDRWNPFDDEPIADIGKMCYLLRRVVNTNLDRLVKLGEIIDKHRGVVVFYNYDFELELVKEYLRGIRVLKMVDEGTMAYNISVAEWNGHKHEPIPESRYWVYLVNYVGGAEGWECITTDAMVFFSQSYSYKQMIQAAGRIDRLNTFYTDLHYYHFKSRSPIDVAISRALSGKRDFNERRFLAAK